MGTTQAQEGIGGRERHWMRIEHKENIWQDPAVRGALTVPGVAAGPADVAIRQVNRPLSPQ